jgi:hypothetical protein
MLLACGIPEKRILVIDVEGKKLLKGDENYIEL